MNLAQADQKGCGCPFPGAVPGKAGWGSGHPGLVEGPWQEDGMR